jgi:hypothetical protein
MSGNPSETRGTRCEAYITVEYSGDAKDLADKLYPGFSDSIEAISGLPEGAYGDNVNFDVNSYSGDCTDGYKTEYTGEVDVDCGMSVCGRTCAPGRACERAADCDDFQCIDGKCANGALALSAVFGLAMAVVMAMLAM